MSFTYLSLFSGIGGLDLGLDRAGMTCVGQVEWDPYCRTVLDRHWPEVSKHDDVRTAPAWWLGRGGAAVDLVAGGFPCQPVSTMGKRRAQDDPRWGWPWFADVLRAVRPRYVLLENVAGHRSLGFGRVLADLAALGYVGSWRSVRASDTGAAHRRERVFILAWREGDSPAGLFGGVAAVRPGGRGGADPVLSPLLPTPRATDTGTPGRRCSPGFRPPLSEVVLPLLKTPTAQLAINGGSQHPDKRREGGPVPTLADQVEHLLPTPRASDGEKGGPNQRGSKGDLMLPAAVQPERWGQFAAAVARWEAAIGRSAPDPTEPGRTGERLSPRFVEWLMGVPAGHVTEVVGKNDALKLLGNGVVPQQLAYALVLLAGAGEAARPLPA